MNEDSPGWTGIGYADVPVTDQLFAITWASQGDPATNASAANAYPGWVSFAGSVFFAKDALTGDEVSHLDRYTLQRCTYILVEGAG
jgi:hypothetical protein